MVHKKPQIQHSRADEAQALGVYRWHRQNQQVQALAVGGMPDHIHVLLSLPATLLIAKAVQLIKGGSSKWMNDHLPRRSFAWQDSYGVFTIGISQVKKTVQYINDQERHHAKSTFEEEFRRILDRHGIKEFRG